MKRTILLALFAILLTMCVKASDIFALAIEGETCEKVPVRISTSRNYSFCPFLKDKKERRITGLSVDGSFVRNNRHYLVRIILKDKEGKEHLVMESYKEVNDKTSCSFSNYCEETRHLDNILPDSIKIIVKGASLQLSKICYTIDESWGAREKSQAQKPAKEFTRTAQLKDFVKRINAYNVSHNKLWRAGVTELSLKEYESKMRILGLDDDEPTDGIEYYVDGIFEVGDFEDAVPTRSSYNSQLTFVDSFDWRNQHGKNWITPNKNQGESGYCYFFTCAACVEAMTNLYYNKLVNLSLSPQELACCTGITNSYQYGIPLNHDYLKKPLDYLVLNGVCDSAAYPFVDDPTQTNCRSSEITPNELVHINGYDSVHIIEDSLKKALIKHGPLISSYSRWVPQHKGHSMLIVGFGQLHVGDSIYHWVNADGTSNGAFTVEEGDPHVGMTYWIYKNSYGNMLDEERQGYMWIIHHNYRKSFNNTYYLKPPFTTLNYTNSDIVCEDSDGDGYYFWGLGEKPSWCPDWVPEMKDGDDSNCLKGRLCLEDGEVVGDLEVLNPDSNSPLIISGNVIYNTRQSIYKHIRITANSSLKIQNILNVFGRASIIIDSGGELIVDGGIITNANIVFSSGGKLTIKNGGKLVMRTNHNFEAPAGALVDVENGAICNSQDFD